MVSLVAGLGFLETGVDSLEVVEERVEVGLEALGMKLVGPGIIMPALRRDARNVIHMKTRGLGRITLPSSRYKNLKVAHVDCPGLGRRILSRTVAPIELVNCSSSSKLYEISIIERES